MSERGDRFEDRPSKPIRIVDNSAERERLQQAEEMLREAGFEPDADGNWHPVRQTEDSPEGSPNASE